MNLGANYNIFENWDVSLDWKQGFGDSFLTTTSPEVTIGTEYRYWHSFPLQMSLNFGNADQPYNLIYGIGYMGKYFKYMIAVQSIDSIIPSNNSKGIGFSSSIAVNF